MEEKLREYAKLLIEVGLNIQKGQTLIPGGVRPLRPAVRQRSL